MITLKSEFLGEMDFQIKHSKEMIENGTKEEKSMAKYLLYHWYSLLTSVEASLIDMVIPSKPVYNEIWKTFYLSGGIPLMLRFASFCFLKGEHKKAEGVLASLEEMYHTQVIAICDCKETQRHWLGPLPDDFIELDHEKVLTTYFASCVKFIRQEVKNSPGFLSFETVRSTVDDKPFRRFEAFKYN